MSISNLTDEEKNLLLRLSYLDLPEKYEGTKDVIGFERVISDLERLPQYEDDPAVIALKEYMDSSPNNNLANLKLAGYDNNNPNFEKLNEGKSISGFVGYAFEDNDGNGVALFRGSESMTNLGHLGTDWTSNVEAGVGIEIRQQQEADAFYQKYLGEMSGESLVLGHSKGGNLASYVFVNNLDDNLNSYVINAAPLYWWSLSDEQKEALKGERNAFIVFELDPVSQLGYAPYVDKTVAIKPRESMGELLNPFYPHGLANVGGFDENGDYQKSGQGATWARNGVNFVAAGIMFGASMTTPVLAHKASVFLHNASVYALNAASKGMTIAANYLKDQSIKIIAGIQTLTRQLKSNLNSFFDHMIRKGASFLVSVVAAFGAGSAVAAEPVINVDVGRLSYYANRLENVKRRTSHLNDMIDSLYWEAGLLGLDNVLKADLGTSFHFSINQSIAYLNSTADLLQRNERYLAQKAHTVRV